MNMDRLVMFSRHDPIRSQASGKLAGRKTPVTGGYSGIGRAAEIAIAREAAHSQMALRRRV
ncbi:hypothetical protein [Rhizobium sp. BK251]|uniref:hypothetical protein n=1 Tax=Rhizobium sp. BK251 TaxID=2512125 RepID=UPI002478C551|nr:hypothetical protein [Rhizobium sp. BK251]